ncbi:MAG: methyltransferase domain-containing protein [Anaerolineae bacterium]|nr:methyltransferase domain-containing protein [Anaerolineae bacterium]
MPSPNRDYLKLLLERYWFAPPVALWRAIELRIVASQEFLRPILDLGCGDGLIAGALFGDEPPIEVGFDPWWRQLRQGAQSGLYRSVQQAMGNAMPYASGTFGTVFSNSVLEHIPDLEPVLHEAARVLRPGGRFMATVPSDAFRRLLAGYRDQVATGNLEAAEAYAAKIDRWLEHHHYHSPQEWAALLANAGIRLHTTRYYIPASVAALWDKSNADFGLSEGGKPFFRWLASPRLRQLGYQKWLKREVVKRLSRNWRRNYEIDVPEGGVGAGLLVIGERV